MKKILISLAIIIISSLSAILIVCIVNNRSQLLELTSADGLVTISLGEYKVKNYEKEKEYGKAKNRPTVGF